MFSNHKNFGGTFKKEFEKQLKVCDELTIATGYFSVSTIKKYQNDILRIAKKGNKCRIVIGMAFKEGLTKNQLNTLKNLHKGLADLSKENGIYISLTEFHGKIYVLRNNNYQNVYIGSSNFSYEGLEKRLECNAMIQDRKIVAKTTDYLKHLINKESLILDKVEPRIKTSRKFKRSRGIKSLKDFKIEKNKIPKKTIGSVSIDLSRVDRQPVSSLNLCFNKGRKETRTGIYKPRPWYEVEVTTTKKEQKNKFYPKGKFIAYTNDNHRLEMNTSGDNYKNIASTNNREILGEWIKGKLENLGILKRYEPITSDILDEYGSNTLKLHKISTTEYLMEF